MSDLLESICKLSEVQLGAISDSFSGKNRINNQGEGLEFFAKELFSNSLFTSNKKEKEKLYEKHFSYLGNANNPPDIILKNSDAIEVKKIQTNSSIALNSSYPKNKLYYNDKRMLAFSKPCI